MTCENGSEMDYNCEIFVLTGFACIFSCLYMLSAEFVDAYCADTCWSPNLATEWRDAATSRMYSV